MAPKTKQKTIASFKKTQAFTLIELMVVVAIVAILASFGAPAYQDYIRKTFKRPLRGNTLRDAE